MPIALSILVPNINFITNNIFLGHLSEEALAVAGITGVYYLVFGVMGFGLSSGLQALMSRRAGENRSDEIGLLFFQAVRIAIVFAVTGILITWFIAPALFAPIRSANRPLTILRTAPASVGMATMSPFSAELRSRLLAITGPSGPSNTHTMNAASK